MNRSTTAQILRATATLLSGKLADHGVPKNKWERFLRTEVMKDPELAKEFFDLIDQTYAGIGGYANIKKPSDLPKEADFFDVIDLDSDPEPDVVSLAKKTPAGEKATGVGQDGSPEAKASAMQKWSDSLNTNGVFAEVSGGLAHVLLTRHKVPIVADEAKVRRALKGKDIRWIGPHPDGKYPGDDGWYIRSIGGHAHMKIMVGRPKV